jgi:competence protein ComEA
MKQDDLFGRIPRKAVLSFAIGLSCFAVAWGLVALFSGRFHKAPPSTEAGPALSFRQEVAVPPVVAEEAPRRTEWVLYITGGVASPGVYHLPPDSRVYHLVDAAGGLLPGADRVGVNLAMPLADGMHIHVPLAGEETRAPQAPATSRSVPAPGMVRSAPRGGGVVNLNSASKADLEALPGVGPVTADSILAYRESRGSFASVEELLKVKGIGPKKMEALRKVVTVR